MAAHGVRLASPALSHNQSSSIATPIATKAAAPALRRYGKGSVSASAAPMPTPSNVTITRAALAPMKYAQWTIRRRRQGDRCQLRLAGCDGWQPHVEVVEPDVILLQDPTWEEPHGTNAQSVTPLVRRTNLKSVEFDRWFLGHRCYPPTHASMHQTKAIRQPGRPVTSPGTSFPFRPMADLALKVI